MNKRNERDYEIEIDLKQIGYVILDKIEVVILIGIICASLTFLYSKFIVTPEYSSRATVYIENRVDSNSITTYQDTLSAANLAGDFEEMIKTRTVLEEVINSLSLDYSTAQLSSKVGISTADSSRVIYVAVTDTDPYEAKRILDELVTVAQNKSADMLNVDSIKIWDFGSINTNPISPNITKNVIIVFAAAVFVSIASILIKYALDDTFKRPEDVEKKLGLSVLGAIPYESGKKKKSKFKLKKR